VTHTRLSNTAGDANNDNTCDECRDATQLGDATCNNYGGDTRLDNTNGEDSTTPRPAWARRRFYL